MNSHAKWLRQCADEIALAGHAGWGNTCTQAADEIDSLQCQIEQLERACAEYHVEVTKLKRSLPHDAT